MQWCFLDGLHSLFGISKLVSFWETTTVAAWRKNRKRESADRTMLGGCFAHIPAAQPAVCNKILSGARSETPSGRNRHAHLTRRVAPVGSGRPAALPLPPHSPAGCLVSVFACLLFALSECNLSG